ncbi:glycoside hydrolase family 1 protein [Geminicoccus flavidas]|uniref:beta-glucosidase n=1 Tax=Geminicoccus flavidas TaxID=2506407 RepID=UPI00135B75CC|nr:beta-glucosidase [Geminicoccus flavidas]
MQDEFLFRSFLMGGFECSCHRRRGGGRRLDLIRSTMHDQLAEADYRQLREFGLHTIRDGLRWHLIEASQGSYDWSSFLPMLRAARRAEVQVIWDLCHYGWPDHLDIWSAAFPERFARFAAETARLVREESDAIPLYCPMNEISFWAWAGGDVARMNPGTRGRGGELKRQLVRAALAAVREIRAVEPRARFVYAEPAIHITSAALSGKARAAAEAYRLAQFEAYDLLCGRIEPELGGSPDCLDIIGANFYPENQWYYRGRTIPFGHHAYRPFRTMLAELHARYGRPILVSETGAEGSARPSWLHYVCAEVRAAMALGVPVLGICFYPILDYPGWDNNRHCDVGLLSKPDSLGRRSVCEPLRDEFERQQMTFQTITTSVSSDRPVLALADGDD